MRMSHWDHPKATKIFNMGLGKHTFGDDDEIMHVLIIAEQVSLGFFMCGELMMVGRWGYCKKMDRYDIEGGHIVAIVNKSNLQVDIRYDDTGMVAVLDGTIVMDIPVTPSSEYTIRETCSKIKPCGEAHLELFAPKPNMIPASASFTVHKTSYRVVFETNHGPGFIKSQCNFIINNYISYMSPWVMGSHACHGLVALEHVVYARYGDVYAVMVGQVERTYTGITDVIYEYMH